MRLVVASLNYSSWSVRAWLALRHAGAQFRTHTIPLRMVDDWKERILQFSGAGRVPVLVDGALSVHEALAICEYANERFPEARLWPGELALRSRARAVSSEMATNFSSLREELPMNHRLHRPKELSQAARAEVARVFDIFHASLDACGGPFLFGHFTVADCMYVPVLSRFQTYGVELDATLQGYANAIWEQPAVKDWLALVPGEPAISAYD